MKQRIVCLLLCLMLLSGILAVPVSANFDLSYYSESIYSGGILDLFAWVGEEDLSGYTFQWQAKGMNTWLDLEDNEHYKGTKTNHLQMYTDADKDPSGWEEIPFRCLVTKGGETKSTSNIHIQIYPYSDLQKDLKAWGFGLYEPQITNVTGLTTDDYVTYTAEAYAGDTLEILCGGNTATQKNILAHSEIELKREIRIWEDGKRIDTGDRTTYIPYTISNKAVKIEMNMRIVMAGKDMGVYDTKTIYINTRKPESIARGVTTTACSMLRYPYNESEIVGTLPQSAVVQVLGKTGGYYKVYVRSIVSFIPEGLVRVDTPTEDTTAIGHIEVTVPSPVAGQTPPTTCQIGTVGCELYKVDPVSWIDEETGRILKSGEKFREGKSYTLQIWVAAKPGYRFQTDASGNPRLTGTINGNLPPYISKAYEQEPQRVVELTYTFASTPAAPEPTEPTEPAHTHTPSGWRTTQVYHYTVCTTCGDMLQQEDHKGGIATCSQTGVCTACGYGYLPTNENHTPDTGKWIARGSMYHFHPCVDCGAHCDVEDHRWSPTYLHQEKSGHAYICADCKALSEIEPHNPGPAATETTPQTCKDCDYIIQPVKNHKHDLTRVPQTPATCTEEGNIEYYFCTGCNDCFTDGAGKDKIPETVSVMVGALGHTASDSWEQDEQFHWRVCTVCGEVLEETKMLHQELQGKCTTCGCAMSSPEQEPTEQTTPTKPDTGNTSEPQQTTPKDSKPFNWAMLVMIGLVCFGASITVTVIILKKKKK